MHFNIRRRSRLGCGARLYAFVFREPETKELSYERRVVKHDEEEAIRQYLSRIAGELGE